MCEGAPFEVEFYALVDGVVTLYAAGSREEVEAATREAHEINARQDTALDGLSEGDRYFYTKLGELANIEVQVTKTVLDGLDRDVRTRKGLRAGLPRHRGADETERDKKGEPRIGLGRFRFTPMSWE